MTTFKREFEFAENINVIIAKNVRKYRKLKNITQEQLAIDIGISPDYYRRYESQKGKQGLKIKNLYKISRVLKVPLDNFVQEIDDDED